jgi:hypothetical protein
MTAIRSHQEPRTILDFSYGKYSKNKIKLALEQCSLASLVENKQYEITLYRNIIKVGMYSIKIELPLDLEGLHTLKEFRDFEISIFDSLDPKAKRIDLKKDSRFRNQDWALHNSFGNLRIKHLIDAIVYCKRLDRLKAFL